MLQKLDQDPRLAGDAVVSRLRQVMLTRDYVSDRMNVEEVLLRLLEKNRRNRMAFDFLLAHYLCVGRPDQVVANLQYLEDFGYDHIPRHFQEAVVVHASATDDWSLAEQYRIDPEIRSQDLLFKQILAGTASRQDAMEMAAAAGLGDSYLFFFLFGRSGW